MLIQYNYRDIRTKSKRTLINPLQLFMHQSCHGGVWRTAYTMESFGIPAAAATYLKMYSLFIVLAISLLVATFNYIISGDAVSFDWMA